MRSLILLVLLLSAWWASAQSAGDETAKVKEGASWVSSSFHWLERQRNDWSTRFTGSVSSLDNYLARDTFDSSVINKSYILINVNPFFSSGFDEELDASIRVRLDIPNSRRRAKLFFDSAPNDFDNIADRRRDVSGGGFSDAKDSSVLGVAIQSKGKQTWKKSLRLGARFAFPFDPYLKGQVKRYDALSGLWQSRFNQSVSYFDSRGWRSSTEYDVYRPIGDGHIFRVSNEAQFINEQKTWEFYHGYAFYQELDPKNSLAYSVSVSGVNRPNPRVNSYWARLVWRNRLYKDWLFGKVSPEISFPRVRNFSATYSILFELELYFDDHYIPY